MPSPLATEILRESLDRRILACVEYHRDPNPLNESRVKSTYDDYVKRLEQLLDARIEHALRRRER